MRKIDYTDAKREECSVAVWQRQPNTEDSSTIVDTYSLKHNDFTINLYTIDSRQIKELINFNISDRTIRQVRKNNNSDGLNENSNGFERLDRNPEKLAARLCSEPQKAI